MGKTLSDRQKGFPARLEFFFFIIINVEISKCLIGGKETHLPNNL